MENVLDRGFSKFKGTESKERSRRAIRVAGAHEREIIRTGIGEKSGARFSSFVGHEKKSRFGSECNGKTFLSSKEQPFLSSSCNHCWDVISPGQCPAAVAVARLGPRSDRAMDEAGPGHPAIESWLESDRLRLVES